MRNWQHLSDHELSATLPSSIDPENRQHLTELFRSNRSKEFRRRALYALPNEDLSTLALEATDPEEAGWLLDALIARNAAIDDRMRNVIRIASSEAKREILETGLNPFTPAKQLILEDLDMKLISVVISEQRGHRAHYQVSGTSNGHEIRKNRTLDSGSARLVILLPPATAPFRLTIKRNDRVEYDEKNLAPGSSWSIKFLKGPLDHQVRVEPR